MKKIILLFGDMVMFYLALLLALFFRYGFFDYAVWKQHAAPFSFLFLSWILIFYIAGIFDLKNLGNRIEFFKVLGNTILIAAFLTVGFFYLFSSNFANIAPKTNLFIYFITMSVLVFLWRYFFNIAVSSKVALNNIIMVGSDALALSLSGEIARNPHLGFKLKAIIEAGDDAYDSFSNINIFKKISFLPSFARKNKIDTIVASPDFLRDQKSFNQIWKCLPLGVKLIDTVSFSEQVLGKIPVDYASPLWILEKISGKKQVYDFFKRFFDFTFAAILLVLSVPFWILISFLIKIGSRGDILYTQKRVGQNVNNFTIIKFRTMIQGAEKAGAQWTVPNDSRITKIGGLLRKTRLDELPQLINILKGEMSFVGPRAERPEFHEEFKNNIPFYEERYLVKPGLSGWAQINFRYGASVEDAKEKLLYDLYYVKNRSLWLDLGIVLKTLKIVFLGKGR